MKTNIKPKKDWQNKYYLTSQYYLFMYDKSICYIGNKVKGKIISEANSNFKAKLTRVPVIPKLI